MSMWPIYVIAAIAVGLIVWSQFISKHADWREDPNRAFREDDYEEFSYSPLTGEKHTQVTTIMPGPYDQMELPSRLTDLDKVMAEDIAKLHEMRPDLFKGKPVLLTNAGRYSLKKPHIAEVIEPLAPPVHTKTILDTRIVSRMQEVENEENKKVLRKILGLKNLN